MSSSIPFSDLMRSLLIYAHLVALLCAAVAVAFGDFALLRNSRVDRPLMLKSAGYVTWALGALWGTGLAVVALDVLASGTGVLSGPKLQGKLTVVVALSLNGWLLHCYTLERVGLPTDQAVRDARVTAVLGGVSAASWMFALFLGVAKPWAPVLGYFGFVAGYLVAVAFAVAVSIRVVAPKLAQKTEPVVEVPVSTEIRQALACVIGPFAGVFIERTAGLSLREIDAAPLAAVHHIASVVGQSSEFKVRGPGVTRHIFEKAAAAVLQRRGFQCPTYAL